MGSPIDKYLDLLWCNVGIIQNLQKLFGSPPTKFWACYYFSMTKGIIRCSFIMLNTNILISFGLKARHYQTRARYNF